MRILKVRFRNLNSLSGGWEIDFTHQAYSTQGIFAITGPTGAGKTTILDAICLALYGRTPRLSSLSKSGNEIMSRLASDCMAEVEFETSKGNYRCTWTHHRARKKKDGELQQPRHEVYDITAARICETKIRDVALQIEDLTGMDYKRFTRSMLLAQGDFTAFLSAPPDEKAPILEQITGTEIYSEISRRVHRRCAEEKKKCEMIESELRNIRILSLEEEAQLGNEVAEMELLAQNTEKARQRISDEIAWHDGILRLEKELSDLGEQWKSFEKRQTGFIPDRERLERAGRALPLDGIHGALTSLRTTDSKDRKELSVKEEMLPSVKKSKEDTESAVKSYADALEVKKGLQRRELELIKEVRGFDLRSGEKKKQLEQKAGETVQLTAAVQKAEADRKKLEALLENRTEQVNRCRSYEKAHQSDADLPQNMEAVTLELDSFSSLSTRCLKLAEEAARAAERREKACRESRESGELLGKRQKERDDAEGEAARLKEAVLAAQRGRSLKEWRDERDSLRERAVALARVIETSRRIASHQQKMIMLETQERDAGEKEKKLLCEIEEADSRKKKLEDKVTGLEREAALLARIRTLEDERRRLEDGRPCPLCGSIDHPFAMGNIPMSDETEDALACTRKELKAQIKSLTKLEVERKGSEVSLNNAVQNRSETSIVLSKDRASCTGDCARLLMVCDEENLTLTMEAELKRVEQSISACSECIEAVEGVEKSQNAAEKACGNAGESFTRAEKRVAVAVSEEKSADGEYERIQKDYIEQIQELQAVREKALQRIKPFGVYALTAEAIKDILKELQDRLARWNDIQRRKAESESAINSLTAEIRAACVRIEGFKDSLTEKEKECTLLTAELGELQMARKSIYEDKDTDREEKRCADEVAGAEGAVEQAHLQLKSAAARLLTLTTEMDSLMDTMEKRKEELKRKEAAFSDGIVKCGFYDESDYLGACMEENERKELTRRDDELKKEKTEIETQQDMKRTQLLREREKNLTEKSREQLASDELAERERLTAVQQETGAKKQQCVDNEAAKKLHRDSLERLNAQKKENSRWSALDSLIGSADGKEFRNFVQSLTFDVLISQANSQLRRLTDRYTLRRDSARPLEMNVIDSYQAGEQRSTKNLSGGESFIVSLALALGLSHMVSRNVQIDSLFLDEGFGTLDEETLDAALDTLAGLQQEGKLIGIISHVAALKERIGTQIQVEPRRGGKSAITGIGCRAV
ncbi:MAG: AAA family ATPase [Vulcanimicrobiota bacterium]